MDKKSFKQYPEHFHIIFIVYLSIFCIIKIS
jgi:hypothetical protein